MRQYSQNLRALENACEDQGDEYRNVDKHAKVHEPFVPPDSALFHEAVVQEHEGKPCESRCEDEHHLRTEGNDLCGLNDIGVDIPYMSIPAVRSKGQEDDRGHSNGE